MAYWCAEQGSGVLLPCPKTTPVNATGGGDAMMAGLVAAYCEQLSLEEAGRLALACGSIAVESAETVNPELCLTLARQRAGLS